MKPMILGTHIYIQEITLKFQHQNEKKIVEGSTETNLQIIRNILFVEFRNMHHWH